MQRRCSLVHSAFSIAWGREELWYTLENLKASGAAAVAAAAHHHQQQQHGRQERRPFTAAAGVH
jgi:Na+-transporting methylmalonyl-CoA/oxaloacetate decarboxylase gamma subunit